MEDRETVGFLHDDVPYLKVGHGPPLVSVLGLTAEHSAPEGMERRFALTHARPLAGHFTVYVVNRKRGCRPGESMSDIASHLAGAIERDLGEPVFLDGTSTGGSVALQLAIDRPDLVRRLVLISSAYRLGQRGKELQSRVAQLTRAGRPRDAWATMISAMLPRALRAPARPFSSIVGGAMAPADPGDLPVTLDAEDAFDCGAELDRVTAPTLVIGGSEDRFYSEQLFRATAAGVPDGRVHIFPGWGHGRASSSSATAHLTLGFMLAGMPVRG